MTRWPWWGWGWWKTWWWRTSWWWWWRWWWCWWFPLVEAPLPLRIFVATFVALASLHGGWTPLAHSPLDTACLFDLAIGDATCWKLPASPWCLDDSTKNYWKDAEWLAAYFLYRFGFFLSITLVALLPVLPQNLDGLRPQLVWIACFCFLALRGWLPHQCHWWQLVVVCFGPWPGSAVALVLIAGDDPQIWLGDLHFVF